MPVTAAELIERLRQPPRQPLSTRELLAPFELSREERQEAVRMLKGMVRDGTLVRLRGGRLALPRRGDVAVGTVSVHRDGYGFVAREDGAGGDVFIPARYMHEAMHGDRVAVRVERRGRAGKPEGRIAQVLERAHSTLVGRYEPDARHGRVAPADPRLDHAILLSAPPPPETRFGHLVVVRIDSYPERYREPVGTVVEVLGAPDDPEVEILAIAYKHGLPCRFPREVLEAPVPDRVTEEDCRGREDLRALPFVTIDGETAKDFDDAVTVRAEDGGAIRLWVAIADVGHYVAEGSPLDAEAYTRGTSVYFPGHCIPMLPEALSNGICSLNPGVDRLAMVAEMVFDHQGRRRKSRFYPAVIRSTARLTYGEVRDMVVDEDQQAIARHPALLPGLKVMEELALRLMAMRRERGSLDFDLPEAEVILDLRGRPDDIVRSERNLAHRIIEEFMLAANEAVATFLAEHDAPLLYRIHEPPELEKLQAFQEFIAHFNYGLVLDRAGVEPRRLQTLLAEVEGSPEERMINQVLLRSMKQARYDADNVGHFGLAADLYCHFTSPIRRYPDLVVHRVLRDVLRHGGLLPRRRSHLLRALPAMGEETSQRERRAMEAEREIVELKKCQFMRERVGEEFVGFVSAVQPFGVFVELQEVFVEGLVHISTLEDDFYQYEEHLHRLVGQGRRRIFRVGDELRVRVARVDLERREIDFVLGELGPATGRRKRGGAGKQRR